NLKQIGQLAQLSRKQLLVPFQKRSAYLYDACRGRDKSAVLPGTMKNNQIKEEHVFEEDTGSHFEVQSALTLLIHEIGRRLRRKGLMGQRMRICLSYSDGKQICRQAIQKGGSDNDFFLRSMALTALDSAWRRRIRIRSCILICDRLLPCAQQQTLFVMQSTKEQQQKKIMMAMDTVCDQFGAKSIRLGTAP
ncbi:MAG: hypothetical protein KAR01_13900, partial [Desulfocapsa sp.]|nr:hypothetical protein [Desulfocapsa sp.]